MFSAHSELRADLIYGFPYSQCFEQSATRHGLDATFIAAVASVESGLDPMAVSSADALGLMQIKWPLTAKELNIYKREDLFDPCINIDAGARYLAQLNERFASSLLALAAYHVGPTRVDNTKLVPARALSYIEKILKEAVIKKENKKDLIFDENAQKEFIKGAKIAYETIITNFAKGKLKDIKSLLDKNVYQQFEEAIKDRDSKNYSSETTFIGINSAELKEHQQNKNMLEVTVEFVSEIISCVKDKDNKIVSGDPEKIKKVLDTWKFSKDSRSANPNWLLIDTQA